MDEIVAKKRRFPASLEQPVQRPSRSEAEAAVRTLIAWAGDDPDREGLKDTPRRVTEAFEEYFSGYGLDPTDVLARQFDETGGYDDLVMLRDIRVESHCENHLAPFLGVAHVAYLPNGRIVGISKIARVVEIFAKRLQTQETMTAQIADAIEAALRPRGVAVLIEAEHQCMSTRGVRQPGVKTITGPGESAAPRRWPLVPPNGEVASGPAAGRYCPPFSSRYVLNSPRTAPFTPPHSFASSSSAPLLVDLSNSSAILRSWSRSRFSLTCTAR